MDNKSINNVSYSADGSLDYKLPRVPSSVSQKLDELLALQDKIPHKQSGGRFHKRIFFSMSLIVILLCTLGSFAILMIRSPQMKKPVYSSSNQPINERFEIALNKKVLSVNLSNINVSPEIEGEWKLVYGDILSSDKLVFMPRTKFKENTEYKVSNITINKLFLGSEKLADIIFSTEPALGIKNEGVLLEKDGSIIAADHEFKLSLRYDQDLELKTTPETIFIESKSNENHISWKPKTFLPQGQNLKVDIIEKKSGNALATKTFIVAAEPVLSFNKSSYFSNGDVARITFSEPIENPKSDAVRFNLDGKGSWLSNTEYSFTPTSVAPGQKYTYLVKAGLRTKKGGILTQDYSGEFNTIGSVKVVSTSPSGSELSQASQPISFTFDQPVDHESAQQHFTINTGTIKSFSWQENTMTVTVLNLGYQKTVNASVSAGIKNAGFGLPSDQNHSIKFSTEYRTTKYNVPFYRQEHSATCAVASLRMLLAYRGISTSEMDIVGRMGYNPRPMDKSTNPATWDDPNEMFVGNIDGKTSDTAAGPDAPPVVKAAQSYGRGSFMATGVSVNWMASQLAKGNLIVMFGSTKYNNSYISWLTPSGRITKMHTSSHCRAVIGFKGEPDAPVGFWINDPLKHSTEYWSASQLQSNINQDVYRQAVAVQ